MIHRSLMIRARDGRIRVGRFVATPSAFRVLTYTARPGPGLCRGCGCTDRYGCAGGCWWANAQQTLCSRCATRTRRP